MIDCMKIEEHLIEADIQLEHASEEATADPVLKTKIENVMQTLDDIQEYVDGRCEAK